MTWISTQDSLPCFICFGFQTGKKIRYRTEGGAEHEGIYQGWGLFGKDDRMDITHWQPIETTVTHDCPHTEIADENKQ
ncbi:MAG TPA: hypothetical protein ENH56_19305 [Roseobacter sp.]|uniref:DUF551 domain-containing protein n=1 Tax=marine sediment metagenome TaxID=412755 RepID=A0A0F9LQW5_9ZZZZ|nr:hypothetical protein [Roseobacter sp.]